MPPVIMLFLTMLLLAWFSASMTTWGLVFWRLYWGQSAWPPRRFHYPGGIAEILLAMGVYVLISASLTPFFVPRLDDQSDPVRQVSWSVTRQDDFVASQNDAGSPTQAETQTHTESPSEATPKAAKEIQTAPEFQLEQMVPLIMVNNAGMIGGCLLVMLWFILHQVPLVQCGFLPDKQALAAGLFGVLWVLPPVMLLQGILASQFEYNHPVLDILRQPQAFNVVIVMAVSSSLVAPFVEEFFFRGLLQGWLEKLSRRGIFAPFSRDEDLREENAEPKDLRKWWPTVLTSLAFAGMHFGQGPAPISLFFLSLGIGYLYRQTGSIWPGIVIHMTLNGLSTTATLFISP